MSRIFVPAMGAVVLPPEAAAIGGWPCFFFLSMLITICSRCLSNAPEDEIQMSKLKLARKISKPKREISIELEAKFVTIKIYLKSHLYLYKDY